MLFFFVAPIPGDAVLRTHQAASIPNRQRSKFCANCAVFWGSLPPTTCQGRDFTSKKPVARDSPSTMKQRSTMMIYVYIYIFTCRYMMVYAYLYGAFLSHGATPQTVSFNFGYSIMNQVAIGIPIHDLGTVTDPWDGKPPF